jgi:hypothetical protein
MPSRRTNLEVPAKETAAASKAAGFTLPKTLAACADVLYETRQERYALQKKVEALAAKETALSEHLIENLPRSDATGVKGRVATVTIKDKEIVELYGTEVDRFEKLYDYILKNARKDPGVWSLLQRRAGDAAVKELIAAGKGAAIGARLGTVPTVSVTKL